MMVKPQGLMQQLHPYLHMFCRLVIAWVFLQSGWAKLQHLEAFYQDALNYKILPDMLTYFYAVCLPWLELLAGGYILLGLFLRFAASLAGLLTLSFVIAISIALGRGDAINCGCYIGGESSPVSAELLLRDIGLLLLCAYLTWKPLGLATLDKVLQDPDKHTLTNA
ncbi:MAG: MauE/DoxX family redox-associated membrane protein [Vampirovibrionales bacterium]|nr:MauE/DoxX family redox-associated membrane protein [Vampirovibrionales bacterium]